MQKCCGCCCTYKELQAFHLLCIIAVQLPFSSLSVSVPQYVVRRRRRRRCVK